MNGIEGRRLALAHQEDRARFTLAGAAYLHAQLRGRAQAAAQGDWADLSVQAHQKQAILPGKEPVHALQGKNVVGLVPDFQHLPGSLAFLHREDIAVGILDAAGRVQPQGAVHLVTAAAQELPWGGNLQGSHQKPRLGGQNAVENRAVGRGLGIRHIDHVPGIGKDHPVALL